MLVFLVKVDLWLAGSQWSSAFSWVVRRGWNGHAEKQVVEVVGVVFSKEVVGTHYLC